ncbi:MAG: general secretion pathway protein GspK [Nitrospiraceae bacterium]|nr:MAG: general secretion pathway protein GspK [Nitrospiraceae bacterium]
MMGTLSQRNHAITALTNERGFGALIMVIWIVVMLMAIAGEFSYSMKTEINIMTNFKEEEEAYRLALAGMEKAKMELLLMKEPAYVYLGENSSLILGEPDEEEQLVIERKGELETGTFSYTLADEEGKININTATQQQIRAILLESGVEVEEVDTITDSIMDWRDGNDLHMVNGAEEDYYQSLDPPYSSKDGSFYAIEELLLVKGMTPEILYGLKGEEDGEIIYTGLIDLFTVVGSGRTNINTAQETVLEILFGTDNALNIATQREAGPITRPIANGQVTSSYFTVMSTGTNRDGSISRTVRAVMQLQNKTLEIHYWNDNYTG